MALKPEISVMAALATGAVVYGVFQTSLPSVTDIRAAEQGSEDVQNSERAATWEAAALVGAISLIAKDPTIFIVGGAMTVILAWKYRHADMVNPLTHKAAEAHLTVDDVVKAQDRDAEVATPTFAQAI